MLGQPIYMLIPEVVGFELKGKLSDGATATDLVLTVMGNNERHDLVNSVALAGGRFRAVLAQQSHSGRGRGGHRARPQLRRNRAGPRTGQGHESIIVRECTDKTGK